MKKRAKRHLVDFTNNQNDFAVAYYAGIGLSYDAIEELTGFSRAQIDYRLRLAGVSSRHYRSGGSAISRYIRNTTRPTGEKMLVKQLHV